MAELLGLQHSPGSQEFSFPRLPSHHPQPYQPLCTAFLSQQALSLLPGQKPFRRIRSQYKEKTKARTVWFLSAHCCKHEVTWGCGFSTDQQVCNQGNLFVFTSKDTSKFRVVFFWGGHLDWGVLFLFSLSFPSERKGLIQAFSLWLGGRWELSLSTETTGPGLDICISPFATQYFIKIFGKRSYTLTFSIGFILTDLTLDQGRRQGPRGQIKCLSGSNSSVGNNKEKKIIWLSSDLTLKRR